MRAVVIGGGITGTLTARELLLAGWDVTLLEAHTLGAGSSSRTAAGIRQQFSTPATVRGMRYAVRKYLEFADETTDGHSPIVQSGYLFLCGDAPSFQEATARVAMQRDNGLAEVEALAPDELRRRFPWLADEGLAGGTWCPTDGFLHPAVVYMEAGERVRALGGDVRQRQPVLGARTDRGRIVSVHTPSGQVEGDLFIDATNAWSPRVAHLLGATPLPISPLKRYLWFLRRDDSAMSEADLLAMPMVVAPTGVYFRPENGSSLLMGWAHDTPPETAFSYEDQDTIDAPYAHGGDPESRPVQAWLHASEVVPALTQFDGMTGTTAGFYATTPDHNPFLDYDPEVSNLIRLAGFSGHGAMFGPFTAAVARALADAGRSLDRIQLPEGLVDLSDFRIGRHFDTHERLVI
jgi:glycine/D-amino acid oxidase-like deaminating enzyme